MARDTLAQFGHPQGIGIAQKLFLQCPLRRGNDALRCRRARLSDFQMNNIFAGRGEVVGGAHDVHNDKRIDQSALSDFQNHLIVPWIDAAQGSFFIGANRQAVGARFGDKLTTGFPWQTRGASEAVDPPQPVLNLQRIAGLLQKVLHRF